MPRADLGSISLFAILRCWMLDLISTSEIMQIGGAFFESYGPKVLPSKLFCRSIALSEPISMKDWSSLSTWPFELPLKLL